MSEQNKLNLSIVVPVYNASKTLEVLTENLNKELSPTYDKNVEIILVNDGSMDNSWEVIQSICCRRRNVVGVNLFRNFGQINALMAGFSFARGKYVVIMDDDLQNPPEEVHKLINVLKEGNDFVYAIPEIRQDAVLKRVFSFINDKTLYLFANKPSNIKLSSFLGMTIETVSQIRKYSGPFPYLAGLLFKITTKGKTIKVRHNSRAFGSSNYNLRKMIRLYLSGITNFSIIPLRISLVLGFLVASASLIFGSALIILKIFNFQFQVGWASLAVMVSLLSGVILISLGVVGEYVGRIFFILNSQPQFIVRDSINAKNADM